MWQLKKTMVVSGRRKVSIFNFTIFAKFQVSWGSFSIQVEMFSFGIVLMERSRNVGIFRRFFMIQMSTQMVWVCRRRRRFLLVMGCISTQQRFWLMVIIRKMLMNKLVLMILLTTRQRRVSKGQWNWFQMFFVQKGKFKINIRSEVVRFVRQIFVTFRRRRGKRKIDSIKRFFLRSQKQMAMIKVGNILCSRFQVF